MNGSVFIAAKSHPLIFLTNLFSQNMKKINAFLLDRYPSTQEMCSLNSSKYGCHTKKKS